MQRPAVTAVIPTRNRPDQVCRAVRSALGQTFQALEIIVVIDGADVATVNALEAIRDSRLRVIELPETVGGSEARNIGVHEAEAPWVAFLDDDDEWLPNKIDVQLKLCRSGMAREVVVCSNYILRRPAMADQLRPRRLPRPNENLAEYNFTFCNGFQTSTYVCSRELLLRIPFTKGLRKHQDWDWFLRATSDPNVSLLVAPEPLSVWHVSSSVPSLSNEEDWHMSLAWAQANRGFLTPKAYSSFIAKVCVPAAILHKSPPKTFRHLLSECIWVGSPKPTVLLQLFAMLVAPRKLLRQTRDLFFSLTEKTAMIRHSQPTTTLRKHRS